MELYKCKIVIIHVKKDDGQIDKNVTKNHVIFFITQKYIFVVKHFLMRSSFFTIFYQNKIFSKSV